MSRRPRFARSLALSATSRENPLPAFRPCLVRRGLHRRDLNLPRGSDRKHSPKVLAFGKNAGEIDFPHRFGEYLPLTGCKRLRHMTLSCSPAPAFSAIWAIPAASSLLLNRPQTLVCGDRRLSCAFLKRRAIKGAISWEIGCWMSLINNDRDGNWSRCESDTSQIFS